MDHHWGRKQGWSTWETLHLLLRTKHTPTLLETREHWDSKPKVTDRNTLSLYSKKNHVIPFYKKAMPDRVGWCPPWTVGGTKNRKLLTLVAVPWVLFPPLDRPDGTKPIVIVLPG
jgi:hypothetical protein